jgi:hypothetical protein
MRLFQYIHKDHPANIIKPLQSLLRTPPPFRVQVLPLGHIKLNALLVVTAISLGINEIAVVYSH